MLPVYIGAVVVLLFILLAIAARRYVRVSPNTVAVVFGRRSRDAQGNLTGFRLVQGGGFIKWPILVSAQWLSLEVMPIAVTTIAAVTVDGVPVRVDALANVKIGSTETLQRAASERFLNMEDAQIRELIKQTMEGHLRAIVGTMTVEDLIKNRAAFSGNLVEQSARDLETMGLVIDSMPIREITDDHGYIDALGKRRIAEVKRDAQIGEAEAQRDADQRASDARRIGETAKIMADVGIAEADRDKRIKFAQFDAQANTERAKADQAGPLSSAQARQAVRTEEVRVEEVATKAAIAVQQQEALRKEQELLATVVKPAEADKQKVIIGAEAGRQAAITAAQGDQQAAVLRAQGQRDARIAQAEADQAEREKAGAGEGTRERLVGEGDAGAIRARGLAEGDAIKAKWVAEAEGMEQKAEAWKKYGDAAIIQLLLERYPDIVGAMSGPMQAIGTGLANVDRISVVDIGGSGDQNPIGRVIGQVPKQFLALNEQLKAVFGIDLAELLSQRLTHSGATAPSPPPEPKTVEQPAPPPAKEPPTTPTGPERGSQPKR
jgi:flotillin